MFIDFSFTVLKKRPMDGFDVVVDEADITKWAVTIHGPPGTDFEGKSRTYVTFWFCGGVSPRRNIFCFCHFF
jgi:hypothetical protein